MVKAKSRLVARGFKQREAVGFSETFAPTVSSSCVRLLSGFACEFQGFTWRRSCHLDGMVEPPQAEFFLGLPSLSMGWDQSPVDGNGMGWKLICVVMGWDGKFMVLGWENSSAGMGWNGKLLVWETSGAGIGWYMTRDKICWEGDGVEWGVT